MEQNLEQPKLLNQVLKYGIIIAMVNIIITLLLYVVNVNLMVKWWFAILLMIINIVLVLYAAFDWRKQNDGYLSFKGSFVYIFLVLLCSGVIGMLFNILFYSVIDPELPNILMEASIEETTSMMEGMGMADDQIDQMVDNLRDGLTEQFSTAGILKGFLYSLIFYIIGALIIGAIVKKSRPEFEG